MWLFYIIVGASILVFAFIATLLTLSALILARTLGSMGGTSGPTGTSQPKHLNPTNLHDPIAYQTFHADDRVGTGNDLHRSE